MIAGGCGPPPRAATTYVTKCRCVSWDRGGWRGAAVWDPRRSGRGHWQAPQNPRLHFAGHRTRPSESPTKVGRPGPRRFQLCAGTECTACPAAVLHHQPQAPCFSQAQDPSTHACGATTDFGGEPVNRLSSLTCRILRRKVKGSGPPRREAVVTLHTFAGGSGRITSCVNAE